MACDYSLKCTSYDKENDLCRERYHTCDLREQNVATDKKILMEQSRPRLERGLDSRMVGVGGSQ